MLAVSSVGNEIQRRILRSDNKGDGIRSTKTGQSFEEAWNSTSIELIRATKVHCLCFIFQNFFLAVKEAQQQFEKEKEEKDGKQNCHIYSALSDLCRLFALTNMLDDQWAGILSLTHIQMIQSAVEELLTRLRPNALALVDAFDIPDRVLNSTLGRSDGKVYEALYQAAKKSPLNSVEPFDGYQEFLRPLLDLDFLKLHNRKINSKL